MNLFGLTISRKSGGVDIATIVKRLEAIHELASGVVVTPETCMRSPTVQAVVQSVARRIATLPIHVMKKTTGSKGRATKELQPSHPVARLLNKPNEWQTRVSYWLDATSWLVRYGNYYSFKARGQTGPIRRLVPLHPAHVTPEQDADTLNVTYKVNDKKGTPREFTPQQIHHVRGPSRDGVTGNSPVIDVAEAIALEIAAEKFGGSFFGNGAMPALVFQYQQGSQGHKTDEERKKFIDEFQDIYSKRGRFRALLMPKGVELADPIAVDNDKAQFLATRQYQRSVIAGAFGVPPHLVGDLSRGTFNNVEQQSLDFVMNVVLPYVRIFEAAMERDLLTDEDRASGVIIRFNLDGALRGDFKSRQEGLKIQREMGVINSNEWREEEGRNPISEDDGGETYWLQGPSGQGEEQPKPKQPTEPEDEGDDDAD